MKLSPDDPRLTAYVLEELEPAEQAAVDEALRHDPDRYREVLDLGRTAMAVSQTLRETPEGLTEVQQAEVEDALADAGADGDRPLPEDPPVNVVPFPRLVRTWGPVLGGIAAALVAAWILWPEMPKKFDLASAPKKPAPELRAGQEQLSQRAPDPTPARPQPDPARALPDPAAASPSAAPVSRAPEQTAPVSGSLTASRIGPLPTEAKVALADSRPGAVTPPDSQRLMMERYGLMPPTGPQRQAGQPLPDGALPTRSKEILSEAEVPRSPYGRSLAREEQIAPQYHANESYSRPPENPFLLVLQNPLSTFGLEVDTASFAIIRRFVNQNTKPPADAVRVEEMINYFTYDYPAPNGGDPLAVHLEVAGCPWNSAHRLVRVGLKAREIAHATRPACNLVFLIDVSGSMRPENKLPLLRQGLLMLTDRLRGNDTVGIVTYAGGAGVALQPTSGDRRERIREVLTALQAGGSTHGSAGIRRAYELARQHFHEEGVNRVILCTDGDFNVGITDQSDLTRLIETEAKSGIFLTVLGFGVGNYKDTTMETLADHGNGQYAYIDNLNEAHKVLVNEMTSTLVTVAKDVKLQVEFNPAKVQAYRLIGYENRLLRAEDFNDDRKDAGEVGAGHSVTALYEIVPPGAAFVAPRVDPLKYQQPTTPDPAIETPPRRLTDSPEVLTAKLRWKAPDADTSVRREFTLVDAGRRYSQASADFKFAAAVTAYAMILTDSPNRGSTSLDAVLELAGEGLGADRDGHRADFLEMVRRTRALPWFQRRDVQEVHTALPSPTPLHEP